jgi:cytochrome P450
VCRADDSDRVRTAVTDDPYCSFDLNAAEFADDPGTSTARLTASCPVFHSDRVGWVIGGYPELHAAARDYQTYRSDWGPKGPNPNNIPRTREEEGTASFSYTDFPILPIETDPPVHTAYRAILQPVFTGAALEQTWGEEIRAIAEDLVASFVKAGHGDFVQKVSYPMAGLALAAVLGIPAHRRAEFQERALQLFEDPGPVMEFLSEAIDAAPAGAFERLANATVDGRRLSAEEKLGFGIILVHAGWETTAATISTMAYRLSEQPELREQLLAAPAIVAKAVEEFLRIDSSVAGIWRTAGQDTTVGGCPVARGDKVLLLFGAANRDERQFEQPDTVNLTRHPNHHVAFGAGVHRCLGAALARAEIAALLEALLRHPVLRVDRSRPIERAAGPVPAMHHMFMQVSG